MKKSEFSIRKNCFANGQLDVAKVVEHVAEYCATHSNVDAQALRHVKSEMFKVRRYVNDHPYMDYDYDQLVINAMYGVISGAKSINQINRILDLQHVEGITNPYTTTSTDHFTFLAINQLIKFYDNRESLAMLEVALELVEDYDEEEISDYQERKNEYIERIDELKKELGYGEN